MPLPRPLPLALALGTVLLAHAALAQDSAPDNWFNLDPVSDAVAGVGTERVYAELLEGREGEPVVVAIIDSGVDPEHEDLAEVMWVNDDEIADNGVDDDGNGYVDDVHGWNFIGGPDGANVGPDTYEATRLYAKYRDRFGELQDGGPEVAALSKRERAEYETYVELRELVEGKRASLGAQAQQYQGMLQGFQMMEEKLGEGFTLGDVEAYETDDPAELMMVGMLKNVLAQGLTSEELEGELEGAVEYFTNGSEYGWNPDFDPRDIVGDDYADIDERYYGNNDVQGPDAFHGTHVAGIVAASRDNDLGIKGVADNARIMSVRAVPDGDERDKDVANAIRYAVDNGAKVVNMSFGKGHSWDKSAVDDAVKYAAKNDVLLVHAAGNSGENTDSTGNYPNDAFERRGLFKFLQKKYPDNWIEVGALSWQPGEDAVATFSNYGAVNVDVFSPGVDIYSTTPGGAYRDASGTSMASPVTAGVAALIRGYFPELSAREVREILLESATSQRGKMVKLPGSGELVPFESLSATGAILNAPAAVELAQRRTGKPGGRPAGA